MRDRRGVLMLMYDLPVQTADQRRVYNSFRKTLVKKGFVQMQESVYVKLFRNYAAITGEIAKLRAIAPVEGRVQALPLTIAGFKALQTIQGDGFDMPLFSDDILFW